MILIGISHTIPHSDSKLIDHTILTGVLVGGAPSRRFLHKVMTLDRFDLCFLCGKNGGVKYAAFFYGHQHLQPVKNQYPGIGSNPIYRAFLTIHEIS
jgi:hypothetical protein